MQQTILFIMMAVMAFPMAWAQDAQPDSAAVTDSLLRVFDDIQLQDVTVTAQRPLVRQEIDRVAYDVQGDAASSTSSVLDMLRKVPLVSVDAQEQIRINGGSDFRIYRNGHPDPAMTRNAKEILKAMPASSVKRIEVITDSGAKHDAEGTTAILNIVMMEASTFQGVAGAVMASAENPEQFTTGLNVTTQLGKVVTSLDYNLLHAARPVRDSTSNHYVASGNDINTSSEARARYNVHNLSLGASWEPDSLNLLSLQVGGLAYSLHTNTLTDNAMQDATGNDVFAFTDDQRDVTHNYAIDGRADYEHRTHRQGETFTLSYMLNSWRDRTTSRHAYDAMVNMPVAYTGMDSKVTQLFAEHTLQLDWTRPIAPCHLLEAGGKYIYRLNRSHNMLDYRDTGQSTDTRFRHVTQVGAAYVSYQYASEAWSARAGLRYEHSLLRGSYPDGSLPSFHTRLNDWVPNASVQWQADAANSLTLSYSSSINRPGIEYLNPAVVETPTSRKSGNSHLSSAHNHAVSLSWMHIAQCLMLNIAPALIFSNNVISRMQWDDDGVAVAMFDNLLSRRMARLSAFAQWMPFNSTAIVFNGSLNYCRLHSDKLSLTKGRFYPRYYVQVTQELPWQLTVSGSVGRFGGEVSDIYTHNGYFDFHEFALQRSFINNRLSVSVKASNPFGGKYNAMSTSITQGDIIGKEVQHDVQRTVGITVTYRFGNLRTQVKTTDKTIDNDDLVGSGKREQR